MRVTVGLSYPPIGIWQARQLTPASPLGPHRLWRNFIKVDDDKRRCGRPQRKRKGECPGIHHSPFSRSWRRRPGGVLFQIEYSVHTFSITEPSGSYHNARHAGDPDKLAKILKSPESGALTLSHPGTWLGSSKAILRAFRRTRLYGQGRHRGHRHHRVHLRPGRFDIAVRAYVGLRIGPLALTKKNWQTPSSPWPAVSAFTWWSAERCADWRYAAALYPPLARRPGDDLTGMSGQWGAHGTTFSTINPFLLGHHRFRTPRKNPIHRRLSGGARRAARRRRRGPHPTGTPTIKKNPKPSLYEDVAPNKQWAVVGESGPATSRRKVTSSSSSRPPSSWFTESAQLGWWSRPWLASFLAITIVMFIDDGQGTAQGKQLVGRLHLRLPAWWAFHHHRPGPSHHQHNEVRSGH